MSIDIDAYIRFILKHKEHLEAYVNLDVIPGEFGRVPSLQEVEISAQKSWDNLLHMESFGLQPMPVYHQGEDFRWLDRMVEHGCPYIGISPANDRTTAQKRVWLDRAFQRICPGDGTPIVKTHAFGVTSVPLLHRYPWYSVDSTSWMLFGVYGMVLIPVYRDGEFVFDCGPETVAVSEKSSAKSVEGKHIDSFPPTARKHVLDYLERLGTSLETLRVNGNERAYVNAHFFCEVERHHKTTRFVPSQETFFG